MRDQKNRRICMRQTDKDATTKRQMSIIHGDRFDLVVYNIYL